MGKLFASIAIALVIDGQRQIVPAGAEIPDAALSKHDRKQLLAQGALRDADAEATAKQAAQQTRAGQDAEFQAARANAQDAAESVKAAKADKAAGDPPPHKSAAKAEPAHGKPRK